MSRLSDVGMPLLAFRRMQNTGKDDSRLAGPGSFNVASMLDGLFLLVLLVLRECVDIGKSACFLAPSSLCASGNAEGDRLVFAAQCGRDVQGFPRFITNM